MLDSDLWSKRVNIYDLGNPCQGDWFIAMSGFGWKNPSVGSFLLL